MKFLNSVEAAAALGVTTRTLWTWRNTSPVKGPTFVRIGRSVRYPVDEMIDFVAEHTRLSGEKPNHQT